MIDYRDFDADLLSPLAEMAVAEDWDSFRDPGTAKKAFTSPGCIVVVAFDRSGAKYVDLVSTEGSDDFYRAFDHQEFPGFRICLRGKGR